MDEPINYYTASDKFHLACSKGDLTKAKKYNDYILTETLAEACRNGHLHVAQWLIETYPNIKLACNTNSVFSVTCASGKLEIAKWLVSKFPTINSNDADTFAFNYACSNKYIEVAKWVVETFPNINITTESLICSTSNLDMFYWIIEKYPNFENYDIYEVFIYACSNNKLEIAEYLIKKCPTLNIFAKDNLALIKACQYGYFEIVKLIITNIPKDNAPKFNNMALLVACHGNHNLIVEFLINNRIYSDMITVDSTIVIRQLKIKYTNFTNEIKNILIDHNLINL